MKILKDIISVNSQCILCVCLIIIIIEGLQHGIIFYQYSILIFLFALVTSTMNYPFSLIIVRCRSFNRHRKTYLYINSISFGCMYIVPIIPSEYIKNISVDCYAYIENHGFLSLFIDGLIYGMVSFAFTILLANIIRFFRYQLNG